MTTHLNSYIESIPDPAPAPGREPLSIRDEFLEIGVSPELVDRAVEAAEIYALGRMAEGLRQVVRRVGRTPAGLALNRAILGDDGRSFAEDAATVGITKQSLAESQKRIKKRLNGLGGTP